MHVPGRNDCESTVVCGCPRRAASWCSRDRGRRRLLSSDQSWRKISTAPRVIERRAAEQIETRSSSAAPSSVGDRKRDSQRRPPSGELLHDLEERAAAAHCRRRACSARRARRARAPRNVPRRRRRRTRTTSGSPGRRGRAACRCKMIGDQPADEIPFGQRSRPVDDARVDADRAALPSRTASSASAIRGDLRPLIVVGFDRRRRDRAAAARETTTCRATRRICRGARRRRARFVSPPTLTSSKSCRRRRQMLTSAAEWDDRLAAGGGAFERVAVADVAVDERAGKSAPLRRCAQTPTVRAREPPGRCTMARPRYPVPP